MYFLDKYCRAAYVPQLIPVIKRRVSKEKRPGQYILSGSQQWEVIRNISESLADRR